MLAFPNVIEFLPHEFAGLRASGFTLAGIFFRAINDFLFGHMNLPMVNKSSAMLEKLNLACMLRRRAARINSAQTSRAAGSRFLFLI